MNKFVQYLGIAALSTQLVCAEEVKNPRIYVVDMSSVYENFWEAKKARESFSALTQQAQNEIEKMMQEGKGIVDQIEALRKKTNTPGLTSETKENIQKELEGLYEKLQSKEIEINRFRQEKDEKLNQEHQSILNEHFGKLNKHIDAIAKNHNADFVLNKAGMGVLYCKDAYDLTQEVIKASNKNEPKKAEATNNKAVTTSTEANKNKK